MIENPYIGVVQAIDLRQIAKAETEGYKKRIEELQDFINEEDTELSEYDEKIVRNYIKEIRVFDNRLQVFFKAGIDIDITKE